MSRLLEALHGGRNADSGRRELGLVQSSQPVSSPSRRSSRIHPPAWHAADRAIRAPHYLIHPVQRVSASNVRRIEPTNRAAIQSEKDLPATELASRERPTTAQTRDLHGGSIQAYSELVCRIDRSLDLSVPRCIALTSARPGDGKTCVAIGLARAVAMDAQRRVLLIDANFANCNASARLGVRNELGLGNVLAEGVHPSEAICAVMPGNFDVLAAGSPSPRAVELLGSRRMKVLLWDLKQSYDFIVLDMPHVNGNTLKQFAADFDAIYLVVKMLWTGPSAIDRAVALLQQHGLSASGCILTHAGELIVPATLDSGSVTPVEPWTSLSESTPAELPSERLANETALINAMSEVSGNAESTEDCTDLSTDLTIAWPDDIRLAEETEPSLSGFRDVDSINAISALAADEITPPTTAELGGDKSVLDLAQCDASSPTAINSTQLDDFTDLETQPPDELISLGTGIDQLDEIGHPQIEPIESGSRDNWQANDPDELIACIEPLGLFDLESGSAGIEIGAADSAAETLHKLETLRPFESESEPPVGGCSVSEVTSPDASNLAVSTAAAETPVISCPITDTASAELPPMKPVAAGDSSLRSFRIPRLPCRLLESSQPKPATIFVDQQSENAWAADVLAVSGLLLIAAGILYLAPDALLWF